jgi:methionine-rich copper-binding protein CopC
MRAVRSTSPRAALWIAAISSALVATAIAVLLPAMPAAAHTSLRTGNPAPDALIATSPASVTLDFTSTIDPSFATIVVTDSESQRVPLGTLTVAGPRSSVPVAQPLPDGTYTVAYRVVSTDGHPIQGAYRFTIWSAATGPGVSQPSVGGGSQVPPAVTAPSTGGASVATPPSGTATTSGPAVASAAGTPANRAAPLAVVAASLAAAAALAAVTAGFVIRRRRRHVPPAQR